MQPYSPKSQTQSYSSSRKEYAKRSGNQKQFPSSKQAAQNSCPTLSTASPTMSRHSSGRKVGPFCGTMGKIDRQQVGPLYRPKRVQDPIQVSSSPIGCSDISESIFLPVIARRDCTTSQEMGSGKGTESWNSWFLFPAIPSAKTERKVMPSNRSFLTKSVYEQTAFQDGDSQVSKTMANDWAVSIDLTDAYLHVRIHPRSRKYLRFVYEHQVFQFTTLPFGMSLSLWIFTKLMNVIAAHLRVCAVSLFPYLDDWLIRDLICNRLISHTKYTFQRVQNLGFIPNLKKSDLIPTQQFTFIGMEFLTTENSQSTSESSKSSYSDHQNNSFSGFSTNFPFSFGQTQCKQQT